MPRNPDLLEARHPSSRERRRRSKPDRTLPRDGDRRVGSVRFGSGRVCDGCPHERRESGRAGAGPVVLVGLFFNVGRTQGEVDVLLHPGTGVVLEVHRSGQADELGVEGLGLLDVETVMTGDKRLSRTTAVHLASGAPMTGYEIHIGRTEGPDRARPFARLGTGDDGAVSRDGRIAGSYLHGMFSGDDFRAAFLAQFGTASSAGYSAAVQDTLDALSDHIARYLDLDALFALAR